jgi:hypothetical protein
VQQIESERGSETDENRTSRKGRLKQKEEAGQMKTDRVGNGDLIRKRSQDR